MTPADQYPDLPFLEGVELTELHTHLGSSISPTMLWELAHEQGIKLPTKNYWDFEKLVVIQEEKEYEEYIRMFDVMEKIQSSPDALFTGIQTAISGAYRKNNITKLELRFNPILRNRHGEVDLDHLIIFALQGMERAMLKYPVKVGIILMMDRRFNEKENAGIVKKAIKYKNRGVVGVDLAGPLERNKNARSFKPVQIKHLVEEAKAHGLGVTIHTGEATSVDEMWEVIEELKPDRVGHGIACVTDPNLMKLLRVNNIVLETCPSSNLNTKTIKDFDHMREIYSTLKKHKVPFTINTDGPELQPTSLKAEYHKLLTNNILSEEDLLYANQIAQQASFI